MNVMMQFRNKPKNSTSILIVKNLTCIMASHLHEFKHDNILLFMINYSKQDILCVLFNNTLHGYSCGHMMNHNFTLILPCLCGSMDKGEWGLCSGGWWSCNRVLLFEAATVWQAVSSCVVCRRLGFYGGCVKPACERWRWWNLGLVVVVNCMCFVWSF